MHNDPLNIFPSFYHFLVVGFDLLGGPGLEDLAHYCKYAEPLPLILALDILAVQFQYFHIDLMLPLNPKIAGLDLRLLHLFQDSLYFGDGVHPQAVVLNYLEGLHA